MAWRDLYTYWRAHFSENGPPSRADIDPPLEIPGLLSNLMLIEPANEGFRLRLVGSELSRRAGIDATGLIIDPVRNPDLDITGFLRLLSKATTTGAPIAYQVNRSAQSAIGARGLLLPLVGRSGSVEMILGGLFFERALSQGPKRDWNPGELSELVLAEELAREEETPYGR